MTEVKTVKFDEIYDEEIGRFWLRTPCTSTENSVRRVNEFGLVDSTLAHREGVGIRPSIVINLDKIVELDGSGTKNDPYVIAECNR